MSERKSTARGTIRELLKETPKRGRPRHATPRQSVYVALTKGQKAVISRLAKETQPGVKRADIPDMAVMLLGARLGQLQRMMTGRARDLPEGVTDLQSLYYLWDIPLVDVGDEARWTSVRLSPSQTVELGRLQGMLNALFGSTRSDVFTLALAVLEENSATLLRVSNIAEFEQQLVKTYR